jgi:16S rRNA (guanine527-N7)-methyltransferase
VIQDPKALLLELAASAGVVLNESQVADLLEYCLMLSAYNQHTNLVANADIGVLLNEHVLDSLTLVPEVARSVAGIATPAFVDIGSGGGFPGMILALALPEASVLLIDSVGKKTRFLSEAVEKLKLSGRVAVMTARAEEVGRKQDYRERFDIATARAVGSLQLILELAMPMLKVGGLLLAQKTARQAGVELAELAANITQFGAGEVEIVPLKAIPGKDRALVKLEKTAQTQARFPRPSAQLKRSPF